MSRFIAMALLALGNTRYPVGAVAEIRNYRGLDAVPDSVCFHRPDVRQGARRARSASTRRKHRRRGGR